MQDFRKFQVWQKAHRLILDVYKATTTFPKAEIFALTNQMRRSAVSICANIAEGCGRSGNTELAHFMHISMGSACELEYYFILARDLKFLSPDKYKQLADGVTEIKRMLASLVQKLKGHS
jgi:four helix bundle protein